MSNVGMPLPPGATLVSGAPPMALPPGATLVSGEPQSAPAPRTWSDSVGDFGSELWKQINPVSAVKRLAQAVDHPIDTFKSDANARQQIYDSAEQEFKKGDYVGGASKLLYSVLPLVGPQLDAAGNNFVQGNYAKGAGASTGMGLALAGPEAVSDLNIKLPVGNAPESMYQSAMKPSTTLPPGKVASMVQTGLDQKIPVSPAGIEKISSLVDDLNSQIKDQISTGAKQGVTIDPQAVAQRADQLKTRFVNQVAPTADLQAIDATKNDFLHTNPNPIPADTAQAMKQGTYQQLSSRAYGEQGSATVEAQKSLARGIKEELATAFPELSNLNAEESRLLDLQPTLEKAVQRISNHQLIGIGTPAVGLGMKAATGSNAAASAAGILKLVLDNPMVKSRLAIALHHAAQNGMQLSSVESRIAAYSDALGNAAATNSEEPTQ